MGITEDLVRKRSEHNECVISTLEELSLHQHDIEKIEYLDKWCRDLRILYLQSNLIPKIENVGRLKKLEYINLALNNIERVENLEGCESLNKLDLTVNFVGELTSIETLKGLIHLKQMFLTGNPCAEYEGYRDYVIASLPQLKTLDGIEIEKSERIKAVQALQETRSGIIEQQELYRKKREKQKQAEQEKDGSTQAKNDRWYTDTDATNDALEDGVESEEEMTEDQKEKEFWDEKVPFTPESRLKVHAHMEEKRKKEEAKSKPGPDPAPRPRRLQDENGRFYNVNEAKIDFELTENENDEYLLDIALYKYMETSLCDVDVQPTYVRVTVKGKILQLVLNEEVKADASTAKRSQITGHLLITMPKVNQVVKPAKQEEKPKTVKPDKKSHNKREKLEVDPSVAKNVDLSVLAAGLTPKVPLLGRGPHHNGAERENSADFVDDLDVPPLM